MNCFVNKEKVENDVNELSVLEGVSNSWRRFADGVQRWSAWLFYYAVVMFLVCATYLVCGVTKATVKASEQALDNFVAGTTTGAGESAGRWVMSSILRNVLQYFMHPEGMPEEVWPGVAILW